MAAIASFVVPEFAKHQGLEGDDKIKDLKTEARKLFFEAMQLLHAAGLDAVCIIMDRNQGCNIVDSIESTPELEVVSQELKERCLLPNSAHKVSAELLRGLKDPFSYKDKVKVTGRKIWLVKCVAHCKEFLGTLLPAVHSENSTIVQLEEYLRRYIALGYSVPPSIHKYLTSEDAVTSESWDLPITVKANPGLESVLPLFFDPKHPPKLLQSKRFFNLTKGASGMYMVREKPDERTTSPSKQRGKELAEKKHGEANRRKREEAAGNSSSGSSSSSSSSSNNNNSTETATKKQKVSDKKNSSTNDSRPASQRPGKGQNPKFNKF